MDCITKLLVAARESRRGQTMTEYVLILAAVAVAGMASYVLLGGKITSQISAVTAAF